MDNSPWDSDAVFIFFCLSGFPHKSVHLFRSFLAVVPSPPYTKLKILDTRVQHCLWGEGRGWACVNSKTLRNAKVSQDFCS